MRLEAFNRSFFIKPLFKEKVFSEDIFTIKDQYQESISTKDVDYFYNTCELLGIDLSSKQYSIQYPIINETKTSVDVELIWTTYKDRKEYSQKLKKDFYMPTKQLLKNHISAHRKKLSKKQSSFKKTFAFLSGQELKQLAPFNSNTCAFPMNDYSQVLRLDIDNHNNNKQKVFNTLRKLFKLFNNTPAFVEESNNYGYHLYFFFNKIILPEVAKEFCNTFNNKLDLEKYAKLDYCEYVRLPNSLTYTILDISNKTKLEKFLKSPTTYTDYIINYEDMPSYVEQLKNSYILNIQLLKDFNKTPITIKKTSDAEIPFIKTAKGNSKDYESIILSAGDRYHKMGKIISYGRNNNWTNEYILQEIRRKDRNSKDLAKWNDDQVLKEIEKCLKYFDKNDKFKSNKTETFISNIDKVPEWLQKYCHSTTLVNEVLTKIDIKKSNKKEYLKKEVIPIVIQEIFGYFIYDLNSDKQLKDKFKNNYEHLLIGSSFSQKYLKLLKEYHKFKNTDINRIFKAIISLPFFKQYIHHKNHIGWFYKQIKMCKQFLCSTNTTNSLEDILNHIRNIYLSIKNKFNYIFNNDINLYNNTHYKYIQKLFNNNFLDFNMYKVDTG